MNELRWILIVFGVVLLIGIYLWGRRGSKTASASQEAGVRTRAEPALASTTLARSAADYPVVMDPIVPDPVVTNEQSVGMESVPVERVERIEPSPRTPAPVPVVRAADAVAGRDPRRTRVEPTFSEGAEIERNEADDADVALTVELPAREQRDAPTLTMSSTTAPSRRIERRKIISLRLAAAGRFAGEQLHQALEAESLQHGRYDVFHRLDAADVSIFSVASMVEPGTFDLQNMATLAYPGVTLFAQLPGPIPGVHALQELVTCGKRLQESLGGTLQDDRGVPLTAHRIDRLRQEIVDFERSQPRESASRVAPPSPAP